MRTLKTREAADLLKVSPNTLRMWERKFGFPRPMRSSGQHRLYAYAEIVALRDALRSGLSVSSAISTVREGLGADMTTLVQALARFDGTAADNAMEASLALRSIERSVDEVLLPRQHRQRHGPTSAKWAFGRRWGGDWLAEHDGLRPTRISASASCSATPGESQRRNAAHPRARAPVLTRWPSRALGTTERGDRPTGGRRRVAARLRSRRGRVGPGRVGGAVADRPARRRGCDPARVLPSPGEVPRRSARRVRALARPARGPPADARDRGRDGRCRRCSFGRRSERIGAIQLIARGSAVCSSRSRR